VAKSACTHSAHPLAKLKKPDGVSRLARYVIDFKRRKTALPK
jgi:hypothetical protein